jgi:hypothetical protein
MGQEQRRKRSEETVKAITLQLEYVLEHYEMDLLVLADSLGLVIAFAGDRDAAEAFAAFAAPLSMRAQLDASLEEFLPGVTRDRVLCEQLELDEIPLYLLAVMSPNVENAHGYERVRTGIQRIYRTTGLTNREE